MASTRNKVEAIACEDDYFYKDLTGLCAIGSKLLFVKLQEYGIKSYFIVNRKDEWGHVYLICNNYILDITATQFSMPKLFIQDKNKVLLDYRKFWFYKYKSFHSIVELDEHLLETEWDYKQIKYEYTTNNV